MTATSTRRRLGPLVIEARSEVPEVDFGAELLRLFPEAADDAPTDIHMTLQRGPGEAPSAEHRPVFFHGRVQVWRGANSWKVEGHHGICDVDEKTGRFQAWYAGPGDADTLHAYTWGTLFMAFCMAARAHGLFHQHSGALVGPEGRALLLVGNSGAGKTSTTLALARAGWAWLSDDTVFLYGPPEQPRVVGFPKPFHVAPRTRAAFGTLGEHFGRSWDHRGRADLDPRVLSTEWVQVAPIGGIAVLTREEGATRTQCVELSQADALGGLIESNLFFVTDDPMRDLHRQLLRQAVVVSRNVGLFLAEDALDDPAVLPRLLAPTA